MSNDKAAKVTGQYFYHQRLRTPNPAARDVERQEKLIEACRQFSGVDCPRTKLMFAGVRLLNRTHSRWAKAGFLSLRMIQVDLSAFHHKYHFLHHRYIGERIAIHRNDVSELAGLDAAYVIGASGQFRTVNRRCAQGIERVMPPFTSAPNSFDTTSGSSSTPYAILR